MKSKQILVRIPADEVERIESILGAFPGASPALIIRALLLATPRIYLGNALAKHAANKVRGGKL